MSNHTNIAYKMPCLVLNYISYGRKEEYQERKGPDNPEEEKEDEEEEERMWKLAKLFIFTTP